MTDEALSGAFGTVILKLARQKSTFFANNKFADGIK
jgi:hypothetical protein